MSSVHEILKTDETLWHLFTGRHEYDFQDGDYRTATSKVHRNDIGIPAVSAFLSSRGFTPDYPENKRFAVCLTHDVEELYPPLTHAIASALSQLSSADLKGLAATLFWKNKGKEFSPYRNFDAVMALERKYGAISSFYFLAQRLDVLRFRYDVEDVENEIASIVDNGCEVGLHGGYYSYNNLRELSREKKRLEKVLGKAVTGCRNHYLRFKVPDTWELLAQAGFKYDTTFGYARALGFRNGMCHPFVPFNLRTNAQIDILELPLIIMDGALFSNVRSFSSAWEVSKRLIDVVERYNGVLTILWHNYVFCSPFWKKWTRLYEMILQYCSEKGAWMTSGENMYVWWRNNGC